MDISEDYNSKTQYELEAMTAHELAAHLKILNERLDYCSGMIIANNNLDAKTLSTHAQILVDVANELRAVTAIITSGIEKNIARAKVSAILKLHSGPFISKNRD